jgi:hypothetical protein
MRKVYLFLTLLILSGSAQASQKRKVMIIGIAGVRSDALQKANTPTIDSIISNGFYTYSSWHRGHTISAPSWSTIFCGVEYNKHKVEDNTYTGNDFSNYPYFPTRAKYCLPSLYCTQIVQWAPMSDNLTNHGWNQRLKVPYGDGSQSVFVAQTQLANSNLDVLFVCFDEVDIVGHATGFSPDNAEYIKAIETVDGHINSLITALHNRGNYADEDWIVLLTTDYGGIGITHGTNTDQERTIWWIGAGNRKGTHQPPSNDDPGSIAMNNYDPVKGVRNPGQYDIAVTALDHLVRGSNCPFNPAWNLDGKSWLDSLHVDSPNEIAVYKKQQLDVTVFPNPSNGLVTLLLENEKDEKIHVKITNGLGEDLSAQDHVFLINKNKLNLDLRGNSPGVYYVEILIGDKMITKKIVHR